VITPEQVVADRDHIVEGASKDEEGEEEGLHSDDQTMVLGLHSDDQTMVLLEGDGEGCHDSCLLADVIR
jgi:hypothetical protein